MKDVTLFRTAAGEYLITFPRRKRAMYIVKTSGLGDDVYITVEPIAGSAENEYPVSFAWTYNKAEAVRFTTKYHAHAVAKKLPGRGTVVRVPT